jgi:hypothetical protein
LSDIVTWERSHYNDVATLCPRGISPKPQCRNPASSTVSNSASIPLKLQHETKRITDAEVSDADVSRGDVGVKRIAVAEVSDADVSRGDVSLDDAGVKRIAVAEVSDAVASHGDAGAKRVASPILTDSHQAGFLGCFSGSAVDPTPPALLRTPKGAAHSPSECRSATRMHPSAPACAGGDMPRKLVGAVCPAARRR